MSAPDSDLHGFLNLLRYALEILPLTSPARPAYPAIITPASGASVSGGPLAVTVSSNRFDQAHPVTVYNADGTATADPPGTVLFTGTNTGTANVSIPVAGAGTPATDFLIEC